MIKVGLTGGIAVGKSVVGSMFVELGCRLIDSDEITHEVLEPGQEVHQEVVREFGTAILAADGAIDRSVLGSIVFNDPERREVLNRLVHPAVLSRQDEFFEEVAGEDPDAVAMVDAALMIETGTYRRYDCVIVVTCTVEQQRRRLIERTGLAEAEADLRIAAQMPSEDKARYADFVIDNSGSLESTRRQVRDVYGRLREAARA
jgi:dephospho-CoA kinase